MTFEQTQFNTRGRIPLDSKVWNGPVDEYVTSEGLTPGFRKVIAEQVFKPAETPQTPFYQRMVGSDLKEGDGWTERAVYLREPRKFKPKATAQDDLGYYESAGLEKTFVKNVEGWLPATLPSDLKTAEMMLSYSSVGRLNDAILQTVYDSYQLTMESAIETYAVTMTSHTMNVDVEGDGIITAMGNIMQRATAMLGNEYHYNELTEEQNAKILTNSKSVTLYLNADYLNAYKNAKSVLPSPSELVENVKVVPVYNHLPAPLTQEQWDAGTVDPEGDPITWEGDPPASLGDAAPIGLLVDDRRYVYRPYRGTYRLNVSKNGAGDFSNTHLLWNGSLASRPWYNAVRINNVPSN